MSTIISYSKAYVYYILKGVLCVCVAEKTVISAQMKEHRGAVLDLIEVYLKGADTVQILGFVAVLLFRSKANTFCIHFFWLPQHQLKTQTSISVPLLLDRILV